MAFAPRSKLDIAGVFISEEHNMQTTQLEIYRNDAGNIVLRQDFDEDSFVVITPDMIGLVIRGIIDAVDEVKDTEGTGGDA